MAENEAKAGLTVEAKTKGEKNVEGMFKRLSKSLRSFAINTVLIDRMVSVLDRLKNAFARLVDISESAGRIKKLYENALVFDVPAQKVEGFAVAVRAMGSDLNDVLDSIMTINEYSENFRRGIGNEDDFLMGGFKPSDFDNMDAIDKFFVIADKLATLDGNTRAAILSKIGGDDLSKKIGPLLATAGALKEIMDTAKSRGFILSESESKRLVAAGKEIAFLRSAIEVTRDRISSGFSIIATNYLPRIGATVVSIGKVFETRLLKDMARISILIEGWLNSSAVTGFITMLTTFFGGLENSIYKIARGALGGLMAALAVFLAFNPAILLVGGLIAGLTVMMDDLIGYAVGDKSFFGMLMNSFVFKAALYNLMMIKDEIAEIIFDIVGFFGRLFRSKGFIMFFALFTTGLRMAVTLIKVFFRVIESLIVAVSDGLGWLLGGMLELMLMRSEEKYVTGPGLRPGMGIHYQTLRGYSGPDLWADKTYMKPSVVNYNNVTINSANPIGAIPMALSENSKKSTSKP